MLSSAAANVWLSREKWHIYMTLRFATVFLNYKVLNKLFKDTCIYNFKQIANKEKSPLVDCDLNLYLKKKKNTQGPAVHNYCLKFYVTSNSSNNDF